MRVTKDSTMTVYVAAAKALQDSDPAALLRTMHLLQSLAAHTDDETDATLPAVAMVASGLSPDVAVRRALQAAKRNRLVADKTVAPTAPEDMPEPAPTAPYVAPVWDGALASLPADDRAVLLAVARHGLSRHDAGQYVESADGRVTVAHQGYASESLQRLGVLADAETHKTMGKVPRLPVGAIASALGLDRPHTAPASLALRATACKAWATLASALQPRTHTVATGHTWHGHTVTIGTYGTAHYGAGQRVATTLAVESLTVTARAIAALAYVTRDRRPYGGNGQAVWQTDARPDGIDPATYRDLGYRPSWQPAPILPLRQIPGVSGGMVWGHGASGSGERAMGDRDHLASESAKAGSRRALADDTAATASAIRAERGQSLCQRAVWATLADGASGPLPAPACNCGPTRGQVLQAIVWSSKVDPAPHTGDTARASYGDIVWCHAPVACPAPRVKMAKDGTASTPRCGCSAKRGLLVNGAHAAR